MKSSSPSPEPSTHRNNRKRKELAKTQEVDGLKNTDSDDSLNSEKEDNSEPNPEEPILSHAERRKQKRKAVARDQNVEGKPASKKRKIDSNRSAEDASSTVKRQNSVWVGNMSFKTTQDDLKMFFKDSGEITRINMPTRAPAGPGRSQENRGFAYVDFGTAEAKTAAVAMSEKPLLGRKLLVKDGDDFSGRPAAIAGDHTISDPALAHKTHSKTAKKILQNQKQPPAPTLFFGNLGFQTTDTSIRELLEAHRSINKPKNDEKDVKLSASEVAKAGVKVAGIRKIRMGTFEDSGLCKGFAFVDFTTIDEATAALIDPKNHHLDGRDLVVEYASPDAVRRGGGASKIKPADRAITESTKPRKPKPERRSTAIVESTVQEDLAQPSKIPDISHPTKEHFHPKTDNTRHKGPKSRPRPGAALALAKRESTAIVPSQGRKITF